MDDMDRAQELAQEHVTKALAQRRPRTDGLPGTDFCTDCADEIPEARRKANPHATRCADCQAESEA